jgi:hypothetical protein
MLSMNRDEIYKVIEDFLDLIDKGTESIDNNEETLGLVLDRLALASHFIAYNFDDKDYEEAPDRDSKMLRQLITSRFPNFRYYNSPEEVTLNISKTKIVVGDAIDDIIDITVELSNVMWCWKNTSIEDALWHFKNRFDTHWELHLRDLQLYLWAFNRGM